MFKSLLLFCRWGSFLNKFYFQSSYTCLIVDPDTVEDDSHARVQDEEEVPEGQDRHVHYPDHDGADHEQDHVDKECSS